MCGNLKEKEVVILHAEGFTYKIDQVRSTGQLVPARAEVPTEQLAVEAEIGTKTSPKI